MNEEAIEGLRKSHKNQVILLKITITIMLVVGAYFVNRTITYEEDIQKIAFMYNVLKHKSNALEKENCELKEFKQMKDDLLK
jgi:hypothetical protein